ncbi:MAG: AbrB/MazE/SpoVT family DNA-binding domain-containing protein [Anaerolineae bacterium]|nr:AbrB/MazE/SpoVT family DNA-binding domain-containing protein [Anaerolineae bacterium]
MKRIYTIQENGQVTLPVEWREKYDLKKGDAVTFVETDQGLLVLPKQTLVFDALDEIGEALKARQITLDEMIERGRGIRAQMLKEQYGIDVSDDD